MEGKTLSQAGSTTLIKIVATAIPSYNMYSFLFLNSAFSKLNAMFWNFLWGIKSSSHRCLFIKAWDSTCTLKEAGGLGLRRMKDINRAYIAELSWKVHTKEDDRGQNQWTRSTWGMLPFSMHPQMITIHGFGKASSRPGISSRKGAAMELVIGQILIYAKTLGFRPPQSSA